MKLQDIIDAEYVAEQAIKHARYWTEDKGMLKHMADADRILAEVRVFAVGVTDPEQTNKQAFVDRLVAFLTPEPFA